MAAIGRVVMGATRAADPARGPFDKGLSGHRRCTYAYEIRGETEIFE